MITLGAVAVVALIAWARANKPMTIPNMSKENVMHHLSFFSI